jgi:hypothetical protein
MKKILVQKQGEDVSMKMMSSARKRPVAIKKPERRFVKSNGNLKKNAEAYNAKKHVQRRIGFYTRGTKNSRQLFLVNSTIDTHPDLLYNCVETNENLKNENPRMQIFFNEILFVMPMFTMATFSSHPTVYIPYPNANFKNAATIAALGQSVHDKSAASSWLTGYPGLATILSDFQDKIDDLLILITAAMGGSDTDKVNLTTALDAFVTADSLPILSAVKTKCYANKTNALDIATSCGMALKDYTSRGEQQWSAKRVAQSAVELTGRIKGIQGRYSINWQMTTTPGDESSWYTKANYIPSTPKSKTIVTGLTLKTEVFFRYCITNKNVVSDWSDVISLIIT